ncbi:unnamed protein product [Trichogramma brassicae]|uniref:Uncharacterized protein n=1 Tax=Trichogramma brassicae TaxID=86971 RepID=A0A6H5ICS9_9HYME|nr:unnamed protein product [Trichogramma brassicae]
MYDEYGDYDDDDDYDEDDEDDDDDEEESYTSSESSATEYEEEEEEEVRVARTIAAFRKCDEFLQKHSISPDIFCRYKERLALQTWLLRRLTIKASKSAAASELSMTRRERTRERVEGSRVWTFMYCTETMIYFTDILFYVTALHHTRLINCNCNLHRDLLRSRLACDDGPPVVLHINFHCHASACITHKLLAFDCVHIILMLISFSSIMHKSSMIIQKFVCQSCAQVLHGRKIPKEEEKKTKKALESHYLDAARRRYIASKCARPRCVGELRREILAGQYALHGNADISSRESTLWFQMRI